MVPHIKIVFLFLLINAMFVADVAIASNHNYLNTELTKTHASFIENKGQFTDMSGKTVPFVLYKTQSAGLDVYITETGITYVFLENSSDSAFSTKQRRWERIDMQLKGAKILKNNIRAEGPAGHHFNFFYSHCPKGINKVHDYEKIIISSVYPGIDWVIYNATDGGLKYDFILHPGADPSDIKIIYSGLKAPELAKGGNLIITSSLGELKDSAPYSYTTADKKEVKSNFKMISQQIIDDHYETEIRFELHDVDRSREIIIDPQLVWATFYGGNGSEEINSIVTDSSGNVFAVGFTESTNFPTQNIGSFYQGFLTAGPPNHDVFILKFDNLGGLIWGTYYGGNAEDDAYAAATDPNGNIFVTGGTTSSNFPLMNAGTFYQGVKGTSTDLFMIKFDNSGNLLWATFCGGSGGEQANAIATDKSGNVFVTGITTSNNFPLQNAGTYFDGSYPSSGSTGFIMKFTNTGNLTWSTYWGSALNIFAITTDINQNVFLSGVANNPGSLPVLSGGGASFFQNNFQGGLSDAFIVKFSNNGTLKWSTHVGGGGVDGGYSIITDASNNIFYCGVTSSANFPVLNAGTYFKGTLSSSNINDAFIMKFDSSLVLKWSSYYGGTGNELMSISNHLALDNCGNLYLNFNTTSSLLSMRVPCDGGYMDSTYNLNTDHFLVRFSNSGHLLWSTYFGGDGQDSQMSMVTDKTGNLFAGGGCRTVNSSNSYPLMYPGLPAYFDMTFNGQWDAYLTKFSPGNPSGPQSFSYKSPVCKSSPAITPVPSPGFVGGGSYSSTPGLIINPATGIITVTASIAGTYVVNYSGGSCGCLSGPPLSGTIEITPQFSVSVSSGTACSDNPAILVATLTSTAPANFYWEQGESSDTVFVAPPASTMYNVTVAIGGCSATAAGSVFVSSVVIPQTTFFYENPLCSNYRIALPVFFEGFEHGGYFTGPENFPIDSLTGKIILDSISSGVYSLSYSVHPKGCIAGGSSTFVVNVNDPGTLTTQTHYSMKPGENVKLDVRGGYTYKWSPPTGLSCSDCPNPVASPAETTTYCVESSMNSCYTATCIVVEVLCGNGGNLTVPNAFTPNKDGRNDEFCLQGWARCNTSFVVMIFDRWGEKVFESNDPDFCWDGNYKGLPLNSDTFVYVITASFEAEDKVTKKGNIHLIR